METPLRLVSTYTVTLLDRATSLPVHAIAVGYLLAFSSLNCAFGEVSLKTWREPVTGIEFAWIPAGCFLMGSPVSEAGRPKGVSGRPRLDREYQHKVCVEGFGIGRHEVTNDQFRMFNPNHNSGEFFGLSLNDDEQPAVEVSWDDVRSFAAWLSQVSTGTFRLPTEAEWEYAARGVDSLIFSWGDEFEHGLHPI